MTNDDITPALTPEEWAALEAGDVTLRVLGEYKSIFTWNRADPDDSAGTHEFLHLIALANHALPDTDRHKITRDHVEWLEQVIRDDDESPIALSLLAALRALLPPA